MTTVDTEIPDYVVTALAEILNGVLNRDYVLETNVGSKKGDNMMAQLLRIKVNPICADGEVNKLKDLNFIVKMAPQNENSRKMLNIRRMYLREIIVYRDILTEYQKLLDERGIVEEPKAKMAPKYYQSSDVDFKEIIIMADLMTSGYKMHDRLLPVKFDHVRLALEALGRFHAMSFVLRDQKPDVFRVFKEAISVDNLFREDMSPMIIQYGKKYYEMLVKTIRESDEIGDKGEVIERVMEMHDNLKKIMMSAVSGEKNEPYSVIAHGDFWNNNILYLNDVSFNIKFSVFPPTCFKYTYIVFLVYYV